MQQVTSTKNGAVLSKYVLRYIDDDGVEYFTIKATGKSGMSYRGLARFVGVSQPTIHGLIKKLKNTSPEGKKFSQLPDCLKPFVERELVLRRNSKTRDKRFAMVCRSPNQEISQKHRFDRNKCIIFLAVR
ncbi:MAG: hypothetical protein J7647_14200 [Cyanobacteria bacterium SBLK]|nr:hypothetical protein [Cyanobacteria bacterium SBLK]